MDDHQGEHIDAHRCTRRNRWNQDSRPYLIDRPTYGFFVRDLDGLHAQFVATLASPDIRAPFDSPWGTREFHLRDPDLNGLQFYCPR
jgi:hypothetical protein